MSHASQFRFDPEKPQILDRPAATPKVSNTRRAMRDRHLTTIPERGLTTPDTASISSKEPHSSLKMDKLRPMRVPTAEKIVEELSPMDYASRGRETQHFITGSSYTGTWNILGMNGYGTFKFPSGAEYEGEFYDSCFHGEGVLKYPNGVKLIGKWEHGLLKTKTLVFGDGVQYEEEGWKYCHMPDRRFLIERDTALRAGTESYMTADQPTKPVPPGYYDTGDGFLNPQRKCVYKYNCISDAVRFMSPKEKAWVIEHCRTNPETPVGPKESLYEKWMDPTQPDDVSEGTSASSKEHVVNINADDYAAAAWARMSLVTSFGRKPFIKFDPQADAEMNEPNESNDTSQSKIQQTD